MGVDPTGEFVGFANILVASAIRTTLAGIQGDVGVNAFFGIRDVFAGENALRNMLIGTAVGVGVGVGAGIAVGAGIKLFAGFADGIGGLSRRIAALAEANIINTGKTVLGHWPDYIDTAKRLRASYFDIGDEWDRISDAERMAANRHFLDIISARGDEVILSVPKTKIRAKSHLASEVQYLINAKGYRWVNDHTLRM